MIKSQSVKTPLSLVIRELSERLWVEQETIQSMLVPEILNAGHHFDSVSIKEAFEIWEEQCEEKFYEEGQGSAANDAFYFNHYRQGGR